jgi:D-alanyl-D-alanine carboxypeptidase (penicillin-binding protein 5/6)
MVAKFWIIVLSQILILPILEGKLEEVSLHSDGAILINADTGAILYEKNAYKQFYPASITKIATAGYALKVRGNHLEKLITAEQDSIASVSDAEMERSNYNLPSHWLTPGVAHIGIKKGEVLSLKDLLYGTMIASGGDAANVVAQYIGGTIPTFMNLVNEYLQEIGCSQTVFKNPHGLHHPKHLTTPYDMALLTRDAMNDEKFREIVKTVRFTRPQTNKQKETTLIQTNRLLKKGKYFYSKAIGVKTGYHSKAQNTLVAAAKDGDRTLIAVLMKCKERESILADAINLFEEAFKEKKVKKRLIAAGPQKEELKVANAALNIKTYLKEDAILEFYPSEMPKVKCMLSWDKIVLPISKDHKVGELCFLDHNEKVLVKGPLYSMEDVNYNLSFRIKNYISGRLWIKLLGGFMGFLLIGGLLFELRRSMR